jgi:hypothetical protein
MLFSMLITMLSKKIILPKKVKETTVLCHLLIQTI